MQQQQFHNSRHTNRNSSSFSSNSNNSNHISSTSNISNTNTINNISNTNTSNISNISRVSNFSSNSTPTFSTSNSLFSITTSWATPNQSISCRNWRPRSPIRQMPSTTVPCSPVPAAQVAWLPHRRTRIAPWSPVSSRLQFHWPPSTCLCRRSCTLFTGWWPPPRSRPRWAVRSPPRLVSPVWWARDKTRAIACRRHRCLPPWRPRQILLVWLEIWAATW